MNIHLDISDDETLGRNEQEMRDDLRRGLYLLDYLNGKISIGKFSSLTGMEYEEGRDWLHDHGIATLRKFNDPELERIEEENARLVEKRLDEEGMKFLATIEDLPPNDDLPEDLSYQHDHYLYGVPKKPDPKL